MQKQIVSIIEDFRVFDGTVLVEDVQSCTLPKITNPVTTISGSGMAGNIDMPDSSRVSSMAYSLAHNNGLNCGMLCRPGVHDNEFRTSVQVYDKEKGTMVRKSVKHRLRGFFAGEEKGTIQRGNPLGSTVNFNCIRYEREEDGVITQRIDIPAGIIEYGGVSYTSETQNLLD